MTSTPEHFFSDALVRHKVCLWTKRRRCWSHLAALNDHGRLFRVWLGLFLRQATFDRLYQNEIAEAFAPAADRPLLKVRA